jgi:hypothetical protein
MSGIRLTFSGLSLTYRLLLVGAACFPQEMWAGDPGRIVDEAERSTHATVLHLDCSAVPSWDHVTDMDRLKASWNSSYAVVKQYLSENAGDRAGRALEA